MIFKNIFKKEYRVSVEQDDWVAPEETLIDTSSDLSDLEQPISPIVFRVATVFWTLIGLVVFVVAFQIGVLDHDDYSALAFRNKTVNLAISPPRGIILDRQGKALVKNIPSFDVLIVSRELSGDASVREEGWRTLADTLGKPQEEFLAEMKHQTQENSVFFPAADLRKEQVLSLSQHSSPGMYIVTNTKREYIDGPQFANIIGYTGKVSKKELEADPYYVQSDTLGRLGIEAMYESVLRGEHGRIFFAKDGEEGLEKDPLPGDSVALNIDYDIQKALYRDVFEVLRGTNTVAGAAIVQDPRNGAVLGMVSFPTFDNNIFNSAVSQEEYKKLFESKSKPLFNRVIHGLYNPGSTIKPLFGLAALQEHIFSPNDVIHDCVSITVPDPSLPSGGRVFKNWKVDLGAFNLKRAIANSCNVYFYIVGGGFGSISGLGVERIVKYLTSTLANVALQIDLPGEVTGFVPTPEWKQEKRGERWYQGDTYNVSIGQGDLLVTPLWINSYVSAIANGGTLYKPRVANRIIDTATGEQFVIPAEALTKLPFDTNHIQSMQEAMEETVQSGTAQIFKDLSVRVAAKTGTAEVIKGQTVNSLLTLYAPADNPEIAMTILIEGSASNQGYALQAAHNFLRSYFKQPDPSPLPTTTAISTPEATPSTE